VIACIFCSIVAGTAPSERVAESERALAVMDINPAADGHTLVITKAHAVDIWDLTPSDGSAVWDLAMKVSQAIRDGLNPDGLTLFQANRRAGWQDVFHFHLHLVPRWESDALVKPWMSEDSRRNGIAAAAATIRSSMDITNLE
jgi:histidine triad (HIT) family protein